MGKGKSNTAALFFFPGSQGDIVSLSLYGYGIYISFMLMNNISKGPTYIKVLRPFSSWDLSDGCNARKIELLI